MDFVGIDKLSLLDYEDKVAVVLFCKPCNFRCPFCHNGLTVLEAETTIPFDDILKYLQSRKGLIDAVVVSGGEPTLMPDLKEKIIKLKELGFLIKLDTNGTNPDIVSYDDGSRANALLINSLLWIVEIMIQCRNRDALSQIHVAANGHRTNNRVVQPNSGMIAYDDISHGIIDTSKRLNHRVISQ